MSLPAVILHFLLLSAAPGGTSVIFDGRAIAAGALPESVPKPVRETALKLEPWAEKFNLHIHAAAGDPMLLVIPANFAAPGPLLKKLKDTKADFVARLGATLPDSALEMIYVEKQAAFEAYVDLLVAREDYLKNWAVGARKTAGFWLHRPICAAYFRDPKDPAEKKAEFNLTNQLIHQFAHLLVNAAYGRQPYWVQESLAWSLEQARENQIYAFCHRNGFVARKEHANWRKFGKQYLLSTKALPVDKIFAMDRDAEISRDLAAGSLVFTDMLLSKHLEAFQKMIAAFKADIEAKSTDPTYKISQEKLAEYYKNFFGADINNTLTQEIGALK